MILRNPFISGRKLADIAVCDTSAYADGKFGRRVAKKTRHGIRPECFSTKDQTPSFDGQQVSPSATLPVLFPPALFDGMQTGGPELIGQHRVSVADISKKGLTAWVFRKLSSRLASRQVLQHAVTTLASKPLVAVWLVQVLPQQLVVAWHRVLHLALAQTSLPATQTSRTAKETNSFGRPASAKDTAKTTRPTGMRGFLRFPHLDIHQKGLTYVQ